MNIQAYQQQCQTIAKQFRLGLSVPAALAMSEMLGPLTTAVATTYPQQQPQLMQLLNHMLQCQQRHDWLGLADDLEYELSELLQSL